MREIRLKTIKFKPFNISLGENPSTGYKWGATMTPGIKLIQTVYDNTIAPGSGSIVTGAGGIRTWLLVNTSEIPQKITFKYQRSWERQAAQKITYYVHL